MPSTHKHIRSSTANKRPTTAIADGQIAMNTNSTSPGLFFKDSTGATIIKIGPVHVGATAPNVSPASGGSSGNSTGEVWLDTSLTPNGVKIWNGSSWTNATPIGSTTVQGLLELATNAETQTGTDIDRAVTPAGLQSKVSDSVSTTSSTTIASSTAVKAAYDLAVAAVPLSGGTVTGNLEIGTTGSLSFEGATADGFETTLAVTNPTADRTITLPNVSGTVVTTGDTGTVTSTMLADGTIVNADVNASAAIAGTKISPDFGSQTVQTTGIISHALGTAAAPTVTFTGDTNTGIYSPGADQVAISTNGTGRIFVESNGRLGVNVSNPAHLLQVNGNTCVAGTADNVFFGVDDNTSPRLGIVKKSGASPFFAAGSASSFIFSHSSGTDIASPATQTYSERARIDSSGRLLVGTSTAATTFFGGTITPQLQLEGTSNNTSTLSLTRRENGNAAAALSFGKTRGGTTVVQADDGLGFISFEGSDGTNLIRGASITAAVDGTPGANDMPGRLVFSTTADGASSPTERMRITNAGRVGIGVASPQVSLDVAGSARVRNGNGFQWIGESGATDTKIWDAYTDNTTGNTLRFRCINDAFSSSNAWLQVNRTATEPTAIIFSTGTSEKVRIDSSGRLLVGTSTARAPLFAVGSPLQVEGTSINSAGISITRSSNDTDGPAIWIAKNRGGLGTNTTVVNGDELGSINFTGNNGSNQIQGASIKAFADGTVSGGGANDLPGRLVFSTTADGASSPTERFRVDSSGRVLFGTTDTSPAFNNVAGAMIRSSDGLLSVCRDGGSVAGFGRKTNDGNIIDFYQDGTLEGNIAVSGTTVSYNGAHLSRWSQLPDGDERTEILRGTVLSNIDEMCAWGDEDNEQLNRMKVSDVEGDLNVAGVFQNWDDDDDTYTDDFYCAMTGDFIIRISAGIPVHRGQLLMSAGDGTAKPQDDDIIRSKTIAKVTSNHVTCTYDDGSYCVPCVLMAC
jgi:hypothetical protein